MIEAGFFENERIELLYGSLVRMSPQNAPHAGMVQRLSRVFFKALLDRADLRVQLPLAASEDSEPEPDLAIVTLADADTEHPRSAYLVVEVADSSLRIDRGVKQTLYAEAGVPEYWIIDVVGRAIEVHREPLDGGYGVTSRHQRGDVIRLVAFPDVAIAVSDLLR